MYIVQRQIIKVVDNWSIISTALAGLTMHWGPAPESASASIRRWMIGRRKAAVFPEPVYGDLFHELIVTGTELEKISSTFGESTWAQAIMSLEAMTIGMPFFWTGVGFL